jgi:hypothetical protein
MDTFPEALLLFAAIFLGSIPAVAFLIGSRSIRRRQRARLELKRHVQRIEVHGSTWN